MYYIIFHYEPSELVQHVPVSVCVWLHITSQTGLEDKPADELDVKRHIDERDFGSKVGKLLTYCKIPIFILEKVSVKNISKM